MAIRGLAAARAAINRVPGEAKRQIQQHAVVPTARAILAAARSRVPVRTGALKASLAMQVGKSGTARVSAGTDHARHVEFGTSRTHAQPFMTSAAHGEEQNYVRRAHVAGKALERAMALKG